MSSEVDLESIGRQVFQATTELLQGAEPQAGQILVVGCSTSEVRGAKIGSAGSENIAKTIITALLEVAKSYHIYVAIQCCEHLNRALVVEQEAMEKYHLEQVCVLPVPTAGGALAASAIQTFKFPVVVETIEAHLGIDIGSTLIGMHLKRVAVPVRLEHNKIGQAFVTAAVTRPKLIGGARAVY